LLRSDILKKLAPFVPSDEQLTIFEAAVNTTDNIGIDAKAGTGKTTSIVELAKLLPSGKHVKKRFCAFNKPIAEELDARLKGTGTDAKTFHSMGVGALIRYFGGKQMKLDDRKYKKLVQAWLALPDEQEWQKEVEQPRELALKVRELVVQAVSQLPPDDRKEIAAEMNKQFVELAVSTLDFLRLKLIEWTNAAALRELIDHYSFQDTLPDAFVDVAVEIVPYIMGIAEKMVKDAFEVDFTDQIYWVVYWQIPVTQYDYLLADECLPYLTPVQLADGTALPIGEIVEKRLPVKVLSYDPQTAEQRACEVIGWSKTLNQKPLVKIKARWKHTWHNANGNKQQPTNFVVCTVDHKIWANGAWMYAGDVQPGMVVQVETSAIKSQAYKITARGRETLSIEMSAKNQAGISKNNRQASITVRGGNGRGLTLAQGVLLETLGDGWIAEYVVKTGMRHDSGYPTSYKVDIANPERMIAVEVDGETHRNPKQKQRDQKKQALLETLGWTVLRFSNRECIQTPQQCVQTINADCPLDAVVLSVEPVSLPDNYVYDITVADCHNFYANGILVHNCQDINPAQRSLLARSIKPNGGRIIFVGDPDQSIMGFSGADSDSFELSVKTFNAKVLPLTLTRRCDQVITHHAAQIVPEFRCPPDKARGKFVWLDESRMAGIVQPGDMVVCRMRAPLVSGCLSVIAEGKPATILGSDIEKGLLAMLERFEKRGDYKSFDDLEDVLNAYEAEQVEHFTARDELQAADAVADQCAALRTIIERAKSDSMDTLKEYIETLFSGGKKEDMVVFVTAHKSKGLEADRVFILAPDRMPLSYPNMLPESAVQEMNLLYVALTRAKHTLVILTNEKYRKNNEMPSYAQTDFEEHQWDADEFEEKPYTKEYVYNVVRVPVDSPAGEPTIDDLDKVLEESGIEGWNIELRLGDNDEPSAWALVPDGDENVDYIVLGSDTRVALKRLQAELAKLSGQTAPAVETPATEKVVDKLRAVVATLTDAELDDMIRYLTMFREERARVTA
jgi:hypothetical protein